MKTSVLFLLLPLTLLSGCIMETPRIPQEGLGRRYRFITESFDFINSDFNWATFNAQRSAWQEGDYKNYSYVLTLSDRDTSKDLEVPSQFYKCEVVIEEGNDPEVVWLEGNDLDMMIPLEGAPPEDIPSVCTMEGIYDYIFAVIGNLARRAKEGNEEFRGYIRYDPLHNIPLLVLIDRLENEVWEGFRNICIGGLSPVREEEVPKKTLSAFDRGTFEQEYNAWKELGIRNYRYSLHIRDDRLNESGGAAAWDITVQNGKVVQATKTSGEGSPLEDCTIDGVFDFISSAIEDPSSSGLDFFVAYSPKYHRPVDVMAFPAFTPGETFKPEELLLKFSITLNYFAILP